MPSRPTPGTPESAQRAAKWMAAVVATWGGSSPSPSPTMKSSGATTAAAFALLGTLCLLVFRTYTLPCFWVMASSMRSVTCVASTMSTMSERGCL